MNANKNGAWEKQWRQIQSHVRLVHQMHQFLSQLQKENKVAHQCSSDK